MNKKSGHSDYPRFIPCQSRIFNYLTRKLAILSATISSILLSLKSYVPSLILCFISLTRSILISDVSFITCVSLAVSAACFPSLDICIESLLISSFLPLIGLLFLVSGMLIPLIVPVDTPLWMIAVATAFSVIFAKEAFGGTGMNIFNVALVARAFLFFAYPTYMSGDTVWVRTGSTFGIGGGTPVDSYSGATVLGEVATSTTQNVQLTDIVGNPIGFWDGFLGLIPGSIGETSTLAILLGAAIILLTGVASWKVMLSVFAGGALMAIVFNAFGPATAVANFPWYNHLVYGGFAFGAVFMATDPVTASRTDKGKWIYGFLIGALAIIIRVLNPGYPEGMMLAILFMNIFAPLIDYYVVDANIKKRLKRAAAQQ